MSYIRRRKLKGGKYHYYPVLILDGKEVYQGKGYSRKKDAQARLKRAEEEAAAGKPSEITLSEFSVRWLAHKEQRVKPRTLDGYRQVIESHITPALGDLRLKELRVEDIDRFITKTGKKTSPRTANKVLTILRDILNRAVDWGHMSSNPANQVARLKQKQQEMGYLEPEEILSFLEAANPEYYLLFLTALTTGAREGELLALRWGDIDWGNNSILIRRTYSPKYGFDEPKSSAARRVISIPPALADMLQYWRGAPGDLVFPNENGGPIDCTNMVRREFHPALKRAELRKIRFHDLRHTYAAVMVAMNVNMKWLQRQMGHASISTTLDNYGHLIRYVEEDAPGRLGNLIFGEPREHDGNGEDEKESELDDDDPKKPHG